MMWHLIAAGICGLAAAGIALFLRKISRNRLPKWIIPLFVGIGMLSYQIYIEYNWYAMKTEQLPEESVVVSTKNQENLWRPWTYVFPMVGAFTLLDTSSLQLQDLEGQKTAKFTLYRFERQHVDRVKSQAHLLNCTTRELLPLKVEDGSPDIQGLVALPEGDRLYQEVCSASE
ncbi:hypothetical protein [Marinospirillum perlucidum]|uniref:hypothetical protein n=1 Tax=Marinospirillum perlucidum TaxID=1982602 RepID=UPI000DF3574C|nr:hypothetical protein [Marinospirillum perlucidum]